MKKTFGKFLCFLSFLPSISIHSYLRLSFYPLLFPLSLPLPIHRSFPFSHFIPSITLFLPNSLPLPIYCWSKHASGALVLSSKQSSLGHRSVNISPGSMASLTWRHLGSPRTTALSRRCLRSPISSWTGLLAFSAYLSATASLNPLAWTGWYPLRLGEVM